MSTPFIGEIKMFAGNFAPVGFAFCDGQLLAIAQNDALFSLVGTTYGGDGRTTFALPDLRGRVPIHMGTGSGLSSHPIGSKGGQETVTLTNNTIPSHTHTLSAIGGPAGHKNPAGRLPASATEPVYSPDSPVAEMKPGAIAAAGGGQPHPNVQPFQCVNFIIALFGVYPLRN